MCQRQIGNLCVEVMERGIRMSWMNFKNDKEELEFYREMKKPINQIIDEIHKLLGLEEGYRIYLLSCGRKELIQLKWAIQNKLGGGK